VKKGFALLRRYSDDFRAADRSDQHAGFPLTTPHNAMMKVFGPTIGELMAPLACNAGLSAL
jgi:hypothetical protein